MKILILASNPRKDLNLDREIRDLKDVIEKSANRQRFEIQDALAVRVGDLQDLLFRHRPQIVHFCGHGSGRQGLVFESNEGEEQWVRAEALSDLFRLFAHNVGCVLLNACYSEEQADAIVNHIDYVIGMNQEIRDDAAIAFSKGFYRALGYECSVEEAYEFGKNAIQLEISGSFKMRSTATEESRKAEVVGAIQQTAIPEHLKPILKIKPTLAASPRANITALAQPISQETRVAIQLDIDKSLEEDIDKPLEEDTRVKQYRDRVREFLSDRKLTTLETIRLERLRKDLGLSEAEAKRILEEEWEPIHKARDEYGAMLIGLIEAGHYPLDAETKKELQSVQQELGLSDEEVGAIATQILAAAEEDYHAKLIREQQQAYEQKLQRYEQEFRKAIAAQHPLEEAVRDGLRSFQQQLELSDEDVARIEQPLMAIEEVNYQQKLEQQHEQERKQQEQRALNQQREYEQKLQRYEQEFRIAIAAGYPIETAVRDGLRSFQQSIGLSDEDINRVEEPLIAPKKAAYQQQLEQQRQLEEQRRQKEAKRRPPLKRFEFQAPTVNIDSKTIEKPGLFGKKTETVTTLNITYQRGQAEYFVEELGNGVTLEMIAIPGGTFMMGSTESVREQPQHRVTIQPFFMGKFAVTQAQWKAVVGLPKVEQALVPAPSHFKGNNRPVEQVSWHEAVEFCDRLSQKTGRQYRLPSEAEWEYACRAGTTTPFYCGETITTDLANYRGTDWKYEGKTYPGNYGSGPKGSFRQQTIEVGSFPPNTFGLYDMHGNVWEWCADDWHENYEGAPVEGSAWINGGNSSYRLLRGGSWYLIPDYCRSAYRDYQSPDVQFSNLGFRVVCGLA